MPELQNFKSFIITPVFIFVHQVNGGSGRGGGSGGRAAVHYTVNNFEGTKNVEGGASSMGGQGGAAGTFYLKETDNIYRELWIESSKDKASVSLILESS